MTTPTTATDPAIAATAHAMHDPRVGDRYTEMYSFWMHVVDVSDNYVTTLEASAPCRFPDDFTRKIYLRDKYREHFSYKAIPGYWVRLVTRGPDVSGPE